MNEPLSRRRLLAASLSVSLGASARRASAQAATTPITIANASGNLNLAVQSLMQKRGYLEEFGLQPKFLNVSDGSKIVGGLIGGDIDCSMMSGFGQVFPAIEKGARLKIIAGSSVTPSLAVVTKKPEIGSLKDLEGRTVGVGSLGALLHQLMVALLRKKGVDVTKVRFVNVGASGDVFRAATMGTIDAGTAESAIIDELDKYGVRLIPGGNMSEELTEYTYQASWTSERAIQSKRDTLVRGLAAHAKLYRFLQTPESLEPFIAARAAILPNSPREEGLLQWKYIQHYKPYSVDLVLDDERLRYMQQLNVDTQVQRQVMPVDRVADMSIARDALKLLGS